MNSNRPVLVTGATGYIGGRLVPRLLEQGFRVRCLVRVPRKLEGRSWYGHERLEIIERDLGDPEGLSADMQGCGCAFYLVHSMMSGSGEFSDIDRRLANNFVEAAATAGLTQIVYLGGLGEAGEGLSEHLRSRREVGSILRSGLTPVTTLRAAMIIGSGSASFEVLRYLVERLPVMITPKWVHTECQPIAIRDVLEYLLAVIDHPQALDEIFDIGGPEVLRYLDMMRLMERALHLPRRLVIPVPVLTPKLSSYWIHLITPISARIARPLAEGLRNRVVVRNDAITRILPGDRLSPVEAIRLALLRVHEQSVETVWSSAGVIEGDPDWAGGKVFEDTATVKIEADAASVFRAVCRVGGGNGWYALNWLWHVRGWMDRLVGGPGLRRGRRDPEHVSFGEALDFWRVVELERDRVLGLRAEMKVPGEALLRFEIKPDGDHGAQLTRTALFLPRGLLGLIYWYAVLPLHGPVFRGMVAGIRRSAESIAGAQARSEVKTEEGRH